jgi:SSS family transporter
VYLAFMLYLGFYFKNRTSSFTDFILGNRGIPWFVIAMTMLATLANAQQTLGIAGTSYALGLSPMIWFFLLVNIFIYPLLVRLGSRYRHLNFQTIVDLAEARYPGSGRNTVLLSVWQIAWGIVSTAICFFGGALVIETIFSVPMWLAIIIVGVITVFYCMMGGLNGVVFTDTIQWLIIILGTAFLVPSVFAKFGTFSEFFRAVLGNSGFAPVEGAAVWPGYTDLFTLPGFAGVTPISLIAMGLAGSLWIPIDLGFMQRMLAAKDPREGRRAGLGFLLIVTLWACIMVGMGVMAGQIMPGVKVTDSVILRMANLAMPGIGVAIFVTAIAAAVMSTVSTYLNATAAIITKNIYKRFINKNADDKTMVRVVRLMTPVVAVAALCFAPFVRNAGVFATAITAQIVLCAAVAPLILLSTYWKRMTETAAFWGCLVSGVVTLGLVFYSGGGTAVFYGAGIGGVPAIFIGLAIGFVIYLVASLVKPYDREAVGPVFREIFESKQKPARVRSTDLIVIGAAIVLVFIAILVKSSSDVKVAWPPLSGAGGTITDIVFYVLAAGLSLISIYILVRTIGWVRSLKKGK